MKISCIIVDDEPLAIELISSYVRKTAYLEQVATFSSAVEASNYLQENSVDVIFLDIQMPDLTGIAFSAFIPKETKIVFTTAFSEYALESYKVNALDYLLKPFNYEEFLRAVLKAKDWFETTREANRKIQAEAGAELDYIFVKSEYKHVKIVLKDVLYFEGLKDYIKIWLKDQPKAVLTIMSLKSLEDILNPEVFMRVHRSFIVNTDFIRSGTRSELIMQNGIEITIADQYKKRVLQFIQDRSINS